LTACPPAGNVAARYRHHGITASRKHREHPVEERYLAATKRTGGRTSSGSSKSATGTERPRLRSSHTSGASEKVIGSSTRRPAAPAKKSAAKRPASRAAAPAPRDRDAGRDIPRPRRLEPAVPPVSSGPSGINARPKKKGPGPANAAPQGSLASDRARSLAITIAVAALDKKAVGLEILDVAGRVDYADFLVLMTGRSDRQVVALAQGIEEALGEKGTRPLSVEGLPHASWVLMDFGDVVVHVFQDEARSLYDIEGLWMDARRVAVPVPEELR
jgi:ribosome-associated protein